MARGGIKTVIKDGQLGALGQDASGRFAAVGVASKGKGEGILTLGTAEDARDKLGTGELADTVAQALGIARTTCYAVSANSDSNNDILAAVDTLLASRNTFEWITIAGESAAALWAALDAKAVSAESDGRYIHFKCQGRKPGSGETIDQWIDKLKGDERGQSVSPRVQVYAAQLKITDDTGKSVTADALGLASAMSARSGIHEPVDATAYGPVPSALEILPTGITGSQIDTLDDAGFATFCTYPGQLGIYITHGRMLAGTTSDFGLEERRRVMDYALTQVRSVQFRYINSTVEIGADGSLEGLEMFKAVSAQPLNIMVNDGMISAGEIVIDPGQDILATETLKLKVRIRPLGKMSWIENTISYYNPNLKGGQ